MAHVRLRDKRFLTISVQYDVVSHETFFSLLGPLFGAAFRFWALSAAHDSECGHNGLLFRDCLNRPSKGLGQSRAGEWSETYQST